MLSTHVFHVLEIKPGVLHFLRVRNLLKSDLRRAGWPNGLRSCMRS